jgi:hypothetical protein
MKKPSESSSGTLPRSAKDTNGRIPFTGRARADKLHFPHALTAVPAVLLQHAGTARRKTRGEARVEVIDRSKEVSALPEKLLATADEVVQTGLGRVVLGEGTPAPGSPRQRSGPPGRLWHSNSTSSASEVSGSFYAGSRRSAVSGVSQKRPERPDAENCVGSNEAATYFCLWAGA